jgi:hypothetical protein
VRATSALKILLLFQDCQTSHNLHTRRGSSPELPVQSIARSTDPLPTQATHLAWADARTTRQRLLRKFRLCKCAAWTIAMKQAPLPLGDDTGWSMLWFHIYVPVGSKLCLWRSTTQHLQGARRPRQRRMLCLGPSQEAGPRLRPHCSLPPILRFRACVWPGYGRWDAVTRKQCLLCQLVPTGIIEAFEGFKKFWQITTAGKRGGRCLAN